MTRNKLDCNIREHFSRFFPKRQIDGFLWNQPPLKDICKDFEIVRVSPDKIADGWLFVTNGASIIKKEHGEKYEFLIISPKDEPIHIETLSMFVSFYANPNYEVLPGKIIDIGRPWMLGSNLDHLLVSLPYPYGPTLEHCGEVRILWLQPISQSEKIFADRFGLDALEQKFEDEKVNYMAANRESVV